MNAYTLKFTLERQRTLCGYWIGVGHLWDADGVLHYYSLFTVIGGFLCGAEWQPCVFIIDLHSSHHSMASIRRPSCRYETCSAVEIEGRVGARDME
jgi:hypothetical protein